MAETVGSIARLVGGRVHGDADRAITGVADLRQAAAIHPRPPDLGALEITITPPHLPDLDTARRYADLGVHRLALQPPSMQSTAIDELVETAGATLIGRI